LLILLPYRLDINVDLLYIKNSFFRALSPLKEEEGKEPREGGGGGRKG